MTIIDFFNTIVNGFANFRFVDALDIIMAMFLVYWLIEFAKKTSAIHLLRGVAFVFIALFISKGLGLTVLDWLLENLITVGVVFIAILFQPELRRAFEHLGRKQAVFSSAKDTQDPIDKICRVATRLSKRKVGALILFEQKSALGDIISSGTTLDAVISAELIENIFEPKTPLHDGAMIISNDRIRAASCIVSINNELEIARELGTRHRAGLSASMQSDCVALIVSEETGQISYAKDGKLVRNLDSQGLYDLMNSIYANESTGNEPFLSKLFKKKKLDNAESESEKKAN